MHIHIRLCISLFNNACNFHMVSKEEGRAEYVSISRTNRSWPLTVTKKWIKSDDHSSPLRTDNLKRLSSKYALCIQGVSFIAYTLRFLNFFMLNMLQIHTRGKSLLELWVKHHFISRLTATLNLCQIYPKLLVHVL